MAAHWLDGVREAAQEGYRRAITGETTAEDAAAKQLIRDHVEIHQQDGVRRAGCRYCVAGRSRFYCERCGRGAVTSDASAPGGLPQGWERHVVRGKQRYACPTCTSAAQVL